MQREQWVGGRSALHRTAAGAFLHPSARSEGRLPASRKRTTKWSDGCSSRARRDDSPAAPASGGGVSLEIIKRNIRSGRWASKLLKKRTCIEIRQRAAGELAVALRRNWLLGQPAALPQVPHAPTHTLNSDLP